MADRFPDLLETPAQFQERCGQIALANFWKEQHPEKAVKEGRGPGRNGRAELATAGME